MQSLKNSIAVTVFLFLLVFPALVFGQCAANDTIFVGNYFFQDSDIVIEVGESVAFINVGGTHDIDGITNAQNGTPFNNPEDFFLPAVEGSIDGTCMGVVTFTEPGTYGFNSSIGFDAELGMTDTITVDIFTIPELLTSLYSAPNNLDIFLGAYALSLFCGDTLSQPNQYTVFVPNNDAVNAIGEDLNLNQFDFLGLPDFTTILEYHIAQGAYLSSDLVDGMQLSSVMGQDLTITEVDGLFFVDDAQIIATDYLADNGVVHIIDKAIAPDSVPEATVLSVIEINEDFSIFEQAVNLAYLNDDLIGQPILDDNGGGQGPFTVFAPTDSAMNAFAQGLGLTISQLLESEYLEEIVSAHIIESVYFSNDLFGGLSLENYIGEFIQIGQPDSVTLTVEGSEIIIPDLEAFNGVVHGIDKVFPFELPLLIGSCGTWTATLSGQEEDWGDSEVYLVVDGAVVTTESVNGGGSSSFTFPVDFGSVVDLVYIPGGGSQNSILLTDANSGQTIAQTTEESVYGLEPCSEEPTCDELELTLYSELGWGYDGGALNVYKDGIFFTSIQAWFYGNQLTVPIGIDSTESISLLYTQGFEAQYTGYILRDSEDNIIIDQNESGQVPESVFNIVVCEFQDPSAVESRDQYLDISVYPNPSSGDFRLTGEIPSSKCIITVTDSQGREVITQSLNQRSFELNNFPDGLYIINLMTNGTVIWNGKVVLNR
jgi:uncharacterized surface protein with fasciclin (FAS1) repeats/plastocyanin